MFDAQALKIENPLAEIRPSESLTATLSTAKRKFIDLAYPVYWVMSCASVLLWIVQFSSGNAFFAWPTADVWLTILACLALSVGLFVYRNNIWQFIKQEVQHIRPEEYQGAKPKSAKLQRWQVAGLLGLRWLVKVLGVGYALVYLTVTLGSFSNLNVSASLGMALLVGVSIAGLVVAYQSARHAMTVYQRYCRRQQALLNRTPSPKKPDATPTNQHSKVDFMLGFAASLVVLCGVSCLLLAAIGAEVLSFSMLTMLMLSMSIALVLGYLFAHHQMVGNAPDEQARKAIQPVPVLRVIGALSVVNIYMAIEFALVGEAIQAGYSVMDWQVMLSFVVALAVTAALAASVWHAEKLQQLSGEVELDQQPVIVALDALAAPPKALVMLVSEVGSEPNVSSDTPSQQMA